MIKNRFYLFSYILALLLFFTHLLLLKKAVYGDAFYYYSYLPTLFLNHSLDFTHAFQHFGISSFTTPYDLPANNFPIGPAVFWLIPFLTAHILLTPFEMSTGYHWLYEMCIGVWSISFIFLGLVLLQKTLARFFPQEISLFVPLLLFFTTNLLFYGAIDVVNSHSASFFFSALFFFLWTGKSTPKQAMLLGIALGSLALIRSQDALFALLPLITLLREKKKYLFHFLITTITTLALFVPQFILWHLMFGKWYNNPYLLVYTFDFSRPQVIGVLLSPQNGLLLWTPIIIFAFFGLIYALRHTSLSRLFLMFFLLQVYLIASWEIWWQGGSYSGRMFISSLPLLSFGLAYLLTKKKIYQARFGIFGFFAALNVLLILFYLATH